MFAVVVSFLLRSSGIIPVLVLKKLLHSPAVHSPEQAAVSMPVMDPYAPAGHGVQLSAPSKLYEPATQSIGFALTLPEEHMYPASATR